MKIVGVTACTAGIAHTYLVRETLLRAATELGIEAHIETQGSIGVENALTKEQIQAADVVVISADIGIEKDRFEGKKVLEVPMKVALNSPKKLLLAIQEKLAQKNSNLD